MSTCCTPLDTAAAAEDAAATAAAAPEDVATCEGGAPTPGSRMSAPSPLPNAFLVTGDNLLGQIGVCFGPSTMNVVKTNWLAVAGRLGQAHVTGNYRLKYLCSEKA